MPAKRVKTPHSKPIRLLIADDHAIVRFGLTTLLQYENDIEVVAGESVIPRELKCARPPEQPVDLSDQEREVLAAIARGLTNKYISAMTGLSKDIAKHLISELFAKLGVANRAEAAALAIRKQLVKM